MGFGRALFQCRIFGFDVDFRRIPYGGITLAQPSGGGWLRTRYALFVFAGPLANAALAAAAFFCHGSRSISLSPEEPTDWVSWFVLANLVVALENLVPFVYPSPYGRIPSDGLSLFQLLILRRLPSVRWPNPVIRRPVKPRTRVVLKWLGAMLWFFGAFVCGGMGVAAVILPVTNPDFISKFLLVSLFFGMSAVLGWFGIRTLREPAALSNGNTIAPSGTYIELHRDYCADLEKKSPGTPDLSLAQFDSLNVRLKDPNKLAKAFDSLNHALLHSPQNLSLLIAKGELLMAAGQFSEAEHHFVAISRQSDLSRGTGVILVQKEIRAVLRQGDLERAQKMTDEYLLGPASAQEKILLLDYLSCLPFMEGLGNCLGNAERWSMQALQIQPENLTLKGTRGAVLAEQGRFAEAKVLLQEVHEKSEADIDQGISAFYLALIAKDGGDARTAMRLAKRARQLFPAPWLLERLDTELNRDVAE